MRERVEAVGGIFEVSAAPGLGTRVIARIPLMEEMLETPEQKGNLEKI